MPAAYDTYDYPSYWKGRDYEHESELLAIKSFLAKIEIIDRFLEIGAGYGRLAPAYLFRPKKVIISDPSAKLLSIARDEIASSKVKFIHSTLENLPNKLKNKTFDAILMVRVMHHIKEPKEAIKIISKLLKPRKYLILEFANKGHFKAFLSEFLKGNFTYSLDIGRRDITSKRNIKRSSLPFYNFHPDQMAHMLEEAGFKVIEKRSVSNIRSTFLKKIFPTSFLLLLEKNLQKPLSFFNFGPSIFLLVQKEK